MTNKQVYGMIEMVGEFYRAMGDGEYIGTGSYKDKLRKKMREDIFHEEQTEFFKAYSLENETLKRKEQLDAVCDMFYVAAGNLLENSKSNMTKVCKDGTVLRREDGKIIKPDTFEEPNLEKFL